VSNTVISVENLSKRYVIGHQRNRAEALRHVIEDALRRPWQWLKSRRDRREEFWALKDVSFEIKQGAVVGIIGRNGAGKSTLLKILSRITEPTTGRITIDGRVASLLEVGTGFHPELTGRENIFLNGAILGMSREEIKKKFDEIVSFSETEKFLDTPVKRYSSGMYMRLAFAVAAHLEPEILIVDEVLAVGDAAFQKKCLGKMGEAARSGRTVLFVSHNMAVIRQFCTTGVLLDQGRTIKAGAIGDVVDSYLTVGVHCDGSWRRTAAVPDKPGIYLEAVNIVNSHGDVAGHLDCTDEFTVEIQVLATGRFEKGQIALSLSNKEGVVVLTTANCDSARKYIPIEPGRHRFRVTIPGNFLVADTYYLRLAGHVPHVKLHDSIEGKISFLMEDTGSLRSLFRDERPGIVEPVFAWTDEIETA